MKLIEILSLAAMLCLTYTASAQAKSEGCINAASDKIVSDKGPIFECKQIAFNDKSHVMTLTEDVSLKSDIFEFADAGKVIYDLKKRRLTIYDCKGFTIDGRIIIKDNVSPVKIVEYTLGDHTAYLL